jgi:hypothetical protein
MMFNSRVLISIARPLIELVTSVHVTAIVLAIVLWNLIPSIFATSTYGMPITVSDAFHAPVANALDFP